MANSKDGQGYKYKYPNTSKIFSKEMLMCNIKSSNIYYLEIITNADLKKKKVKCQFNVKYHSSSNHRLNVFSKVKVFKIGLYSKVKVTG